MLTEAGKPAVGQQKRISSDKRFSRSEPNLAAAGLSADGLNETKSAGKRQN
jgi:hypothetical protein